MGIFDGAYAEAHAEPHVRIHDDVEMAGESVVFSAVSAGTS